MFGGDCPRRVLKPLKPLKLLKPPQTYHAAYSYWLKANAQLQAMGIYPLALPDALRTYQMGLELEN